MGLNPMAGIWNRISRDRRSVAEFAALAPAIPAPGPVPVLANGGPQDGIVQVPPDREIVSASGSWSGIGALNLQVLAQETNNQRETMSTAIVEAMLDDATVKSCIDILKLQVLSGPLQFHRAVEPDEDDATVDDLAGSEGSDPVEALRAAEFCVRAHERLEVPIHLWGRDALDALCYGNKCAEKVLERMDDGPDAGLYQLKALKIKARWSYHLCTDPYLNLMALYCDTIYGPAYVDKKHFAVFSWDIRDGDPRGSTILRAAKDPWRRLRRALESRSKGDDQFGTPALAHELPPNAPIESIDVLTGKPAPTTAVVNRELAKFQNGTTFTHGSGGKLYVVESGRDGSQINSSIDDHRRSISTALVLSAKATMDAKHYTQGGSEIGKDFITLFAEFIRQWFISIIRKQVFHYLLEENFGRDYADRYTPRITIGAMPVGDFAELASPLSVMGQAALLAPSQIEYLLSQVGIPHPRPGELRIGPGGPVPQTLTAPQGTVQTETGQMQEFPVAPAPEAASAEAVPA